MRTGFATLVISMFSLSCGLEPSQGFVSDNNTCVPDFTNLGSVDFSSVREAILTGTGGLGPSAAQRLEAETVATLRWGIQLYLTSNGTPSDGLYLDLMARVDADAARAAGMRTVALPDESIGSPILRSIVSAEDLPVSPSVGWVNFQFSEIFEFAPQATYWIRIAPLYSSTAASRVSAALITGESFAEVSGGNWSISSSNKMAYRLITCLEFQ